MEVLRAVVPEEGDAEVTIHGNLLDVLAAVVTVIQGVHEAYRRENPVKAGLFRKMLVSYLAEEPEDAFAPVGDDLVHYADMSALARFARAREKRQTDNTEETEDDNGTEYCEP